METKCCQHNFSEAGDGGAKQGDGATASLEKTQVKQQHRPLASHLPIATCNTM